LAKGEKEVWTAGNDAHADPVGPQYNQAELQGPVGAGARESIEMFNHDHGINWRHVLFMDIHYFTWGDGPLALHGMYESTLVFKIEYLYIVLVQCDFWDIMGVH